MNKDTSRHHCFYEGIMHEEEYSVFRASSYGRIIKPLLAICIDHDNTVAKVEKYNFTNDISFSDRIGVNGPFLGSS